LTEVSNATSVPLRLVKPAASTRGLALFSIMRDEDYFLPFFFEHYRALGIELFVIYDDRSGEPTRSFLHAQADCMVISSDFAFGHAFGDDPRFGVRRLPTALRESAPAALFSNRWVLTVDADEFLVLPPGFADLGQLTQHLDRLGLPYLTAPMVDFYGASLDARRYPPSLSPFAGNPYFDAGPYYDWNGTLAPDRLPAGIRWRLIERLKQHPQTRALLEPGLAPPWDWKVPLLKTGAGVHRCGDHELSVAPEIPLSAALTHFKFYPGLDAKMTQAIGEAQYTGGSIHYRALALALRFLGDEPLAAPATRTFTGPESLRAAGLIIGASEA
jgi:hypothetical protein